MEKLVWGSSQCDRFSTVTDGFNEISSELRKTEDGLVVLQKTLLQCERMRKRSNWMRGRKRRR